jgi:peptidoglycan/xylan/chitin deacetylase (PgdA/CDA1 family)
MKPLPAVLILVAGLVACGLALAQAPVAQPLSHLLLRTTLAPPPDLTRSLVTEEPAIKGVDSGAELQLMAALQGARLSERVLRVAVAAQGGDRVALVKVQAGDQDSRLFSLESTERDAAAVLLAAFALPIQLQHVDFWAVVPEVDAEGREWHRPVVSVAAERGLYLRLQRTGPPLPRQLLARLSAVRYDPVFTSHAVDWADARDGMPRTAYREPRLADNWDGVMEDARGTVATLPLSGSVQAMVGGTPAGKRVGLTVDDGPHPLITPLFLDVLKRENVKATFMVVGEKAEEFPGLIREIVREGHEVGNHTYSHQRFSGLSATEAYAQMRACSLVVGHLTGESVRFLRPPGGDFGPEALRAARSLGLTLALWTHNSGDWTLTDPATIAANATRNISDGDIILMHQGEMRSVEALPLIIQRIRAKGLQPCRLSDMMSTQTLRTVSVADMLAQRPRLGLTD